MQKATLILLIILLTGCSSTPWHEGMCKETDVKIIKAKNEQCISEWMERDVHEFGYVPDPRITINRMQLMNFHCNAMSKYKECK